MHEAPARSARRQNLLDGGFTVALLLVAVVIGYSVLTPTPLRARTLPTTVAVASTMTPSISGPPAATATDALVGPIFDDPRADLPPAVSKPLPPPAVTWATPLSGKVLDSGRKPLAGASVVVGGKEIRTDAEGSFTLETLPPDASLVVKLPGYEKAIVAPRKGAVEVVLRPQVVKAAYLTYFGVGDRGIRGRVLDLATRTEINGVVIDVKGDRGWVLYRTEVEQALAAGAQGPGTLKDFDGLMADFKARGLYTIARIVVFKDNILATHKPEWAVIDTRTGKPWIDNERLAWMDPFREEVWSYNIALAKEAVRRGFDEVQFDYVRFPTDGKLAAARYARPNTRETRLPAIAAFLERARREIGATGAFLAADVFGYTAFNENDTDIGQRIEELAPHLDYISPMVYPSGYHRGIPGYRNPVANSYQVVHESIRLIRKRAAHTQVRVRPWLQDFRDYAFDRRIFGVTEIRAQIKGTEDAGGVGWMLWNPRNDYTAAALRGKAPLAAR